MTIYRLEPAGEFAEGRHLSENSMGGVAAGQSTQGNSGRAAALGWCGLRLNHPIPRNLLLDRTSPELAGHGQGSLESRDGENAAFLKRLGQLRRRNPGP